MNGAGPNVLWFRHGLRLHDNPALRKAIELSEDCGQFMAVFIFDGESAGKFNRWCVRKILRRTWSDTAE